MAIRVFSVALLLGYKGAVLALCFGVADEQDACIKRGCGAFHIGSSIDEYIKAVARGCPMSVIADNGEWRNTG